MAQERLLDVSIYMHSIYYLELLFNRVLVVRQKSKGKQDFEEGQEKSMEGNVFNALEKDMSSKLT